MASIRRRLHVLGCIGALLLGAEAVVRIDDWIRKDVGLLASPNRERDLLVAEAWGFRGRPHGRFRKWQLDGSGFRVTPEGTQEGPRLLILGASETFGLYESPEKEYPAQLARLLQQRQPCCVINAAVAGISVNSMVPYWDNWVSQFSPQQVLIYPSPHFYLDDEPPQPPKDPPAGETAPRRSWLKPRLLQRMKDVYHRLPAWVKAWREERAIRAETAGKDPSWFFQNVPDNRLQQFSGDLRLLVEHIRKTGAEPILVTHALSASDPPRPEDRLHLRGMRMFIPRASAETIVAFDKRANEAMRALAQKERLLLIDADRALSGRRELFADLVHFNDDGAARMAELLADSLPTLRRLDSLALRR